MPVLTIWTGGLLTVTGVIAYAVTSAASVTALIPAFVGILLIVAGAVALRWDGARMHAIHAALLVALVGALGSLRNVAAIGDAIDGTAERPAAIWVSLIMLVVLVAYLAVGIRSFIVARRTRA